MQWQINYPITILIIIAAIIFIILLIKRNRKDEKAFEKDLNQSEINPEERQKEDNRN